MKNYPFGLTKKAKGAMNLETLRQMSTILAAPYIMNNLQSGLIATLENKVKMFPEDRKLPISRFDAKNSVRDLFNAVKRYYNSLVTKDSIENISKYFKSVKNEWDKFSTYYFTKEFVLSLSGNDQKTYQFWFKLRQKIIDAIISIDKMINSLLINSGKSQDGKITL